MRSLFAICSGFGFALVSSAFAQGTAEPDGSPVVVELFTSQSCSSCVPAAKYLEELAEREDIVALGWHVDYWDQLQTPDGYWKDPYSSPAFTERQRRYNRALRGTGSVYTPQMVINGVDEGVGSSRREIATMIGNKRNVAGEIAFTPSTNGLNVRASAAQEAETIAVYFEPHAATDVRAGENAGVTFADVNIVTRVQAIGPANGAPAAVKAPKAGERCAILVQRPDHGPILAARYCPDPAS